MIQEQRAQSDPRGPPPPLLSPPLQADDKLKSNAPTAGDRPPPPPTGQVRVITSVPPGVSGWVNRTSALTGPDGTPAPDNFLLLCQVRGLILLDNQELQVESNWTSRGWSSNVIWQRLVDNTAAAQRLWKYFLFFFRYICFDCEGSGDMQRQATVQNHIHTFNPAFVFVDVKQVLPGRPQTTLPPCTCK